MLFELTEEQSDLRTLARDYFSREFPVDRLRALWEGQEVDLAAIWKGLAEMGLFGMAVAEKHGGFGASQLEPGLVLEEAGYAGLPMPVAETGVAALLLSEFAADEQRDTWLPRIIAGDATVSLAIDGSDFVVWGQEADAVVVARGHELHLVPGTDVTWRALAAEDVTRRLALAEFGELGPATLVVADAEAVERAHDIARTATAAMLVGVTQRLLDLARAYSLERTQFGQPIASFQVLKHRMADMAVGIEAARGLAWYAAYAVTHDPDGAALAARTAKASASSAAHDGNRSALQIHGGIGFTWEQDLHFWLKRGRALEAAYGNASDHRVALGRAVIAELAGA